MIEHAGAALKAELTYLMELELSNILLALKSTDYANVVLRFPNPLSRLLLTSTPSECNGFRMPDLMQNFAFVFNIQASLEDTHTRIIYSLTLPRLRMHCVVMEYVRQRSHKLNLGKFLAWTNALAGCPGKEVFLCV